MDVDLVVVRREGEEKVLTWMSIYSGEKRGVGERADLDVDLVRVGAKLGSEELPKACLEACYIPTGSE